MKKIVYIIFALSACSCHFDQDQETLSKLSILPSFDMLLLDSATVFNTSQIPAGKPVLFLYFRPDCPHCRQETIDFLQHMNDFKNTRIYFLAGVALEDIKGFSLNYNLGQFANITVGKDHNHSFFRHFRPSSIPYLAIYNKEKQLVRIYDEQVPVDRVINTLHK